MHSATFSLHTVKTKKALFNIDRKRREKLQHALNCPETAENHGGQICPHIWWKKFIHFDASMAERLRRQFQGTQMSSVAIDGEYTGSKERRFESCLMQIFCAAFAKLATSKPHYFG